MTMVSDEQRPTLVTSLHTDRYVNDRDDDYAWECLMGDQSPEMFVEFSRGSPADAAREYAADWCGVQMGGYFEMPCHESGGVTRYKIRESDVAGLAEFIDDLLPAPAVQDDAEKTQTT
jgi:hypothetical protein